MTAKPHWLAVLEAEVSSSSIAATAKKLGYSRTSISLVLDDKYPGKTDKVAATVLAILDRMTCPHLVMPLTRLDCNGYACRDVPTSSPAAAAHWRACQSCPNRSGVN